MQPEGFEHFSHLLFLVFLVKQISCDAWYHPTALAPPLWILKEKSIKGLWNTPDPAGWGTQPCRLGHKHSLSGTQLLHRHQRRLKTQPTAAFLPLSPTKDSPQPCPTTADTHGNPAHQTCPCSLRPRHTSSSGGCILHCRTGTHGLRRCWGPWRRSHTSLWTRPTDPHSPSGYHRPTALGCTRCCYTGTHWDCRSEGSIFFHHCHPRSHCHHHIRRWWRCTTCYCTGTHWENRLGNKNKQVSCEVSNLPLTTVPALAH